jgi:hypothetical protein
MLFNLKDYQLMVKFKRVNTSTFAFLYESDADGVYHEMALWGESHCNPKDKFVKSTGRKKALARLLSKIDSNTFAFNLTKEDRKKIWDIYFKEHKK